MCAEKTALKYARNHGNWFSLFKDANKIYEHLKIVVSLLAHPVDIAVY